MRDDFESRFRDAFGLAREEATLLSNEEEFEATGLALRIQSLLDSLTTVGAEVSKLRAEVDGLLDENGELRTRLIRLQAVIEEKGLLDMEQFELACDVIQSENAHVQSYEASTATQDDWGKTSSQKKILH